MVRKVGSDIIYFAINRGPCIVTFVVLFQHGWCYAHQCMCPLRLILSLDVERREYEEYKLTLKSWPEVLRLAQSIGLCPGANATFSRFFVAGFLVVVKGTARDPGVFVRGGLRRRFVGIGGGGINWVSVRTLGSKLGGAVDEGCDFAR